MCTHTYTHTLTFTQGVSSAGKKQIMPQSPPWLSQQLVVVDVAPDRPFTLTVF